MDVDHTAYPHLPGSCTAQTHTSGPRFEEPYSAGVDSTLSLGGSPSWTRPYSPRLTRRWGLPSSAGTSTSTSIGSANDSDVDEYELVHLVTELHALTSLNRALLNFYTDRPDTAESNVSEAIDLGASVGDTHRRLVARVYLWRAIVLDEKGELERDVVPLVRALPMCNSPRHDPDTTRLLTLLRRHERVLQGWFDRQAHADVDAGLETAVEFVATMVPDVAHVVGHHTNPFRLNIRALIGRLSEEDLTFSEGGTTAVATASESESKSEGKSESEDKSDDKSRTLTYRAAYYPRPRPRPRSALFYGGGTSLVDDQHAVVSRRCSTDPTSGPDTEDGRPPSDLFEALMADATGDRTALEMWQRHAASESAGGDKNENEDENKVKNSTESEK